EPRLNTRAALAQELLHQQPHGVLLHVGLPRAVQRIPFDVVRVGLQGQREYASKRDVDLKNRTRGLVERRRESRGRPPRQIQQDPEILAVVVNEAQSASRRTLWSLAPRLSRRSR